jgi:hypothetical protein
LAELENAVIGVEASHYLQTLIDRPPTHEPLLAALGGDPMTFKSHIENELKQWKDNNMTPLFVFDGQTNVGRDEISLRKAKAALVETQDAWRLYADNQPDEAVKAFGSSGMFANDRFECFD